MRVPVDTISVTPHGAFGYRRASKADGACGWKGVYPCTHQGVDLAGAAGTPVYAPERVTVVMAAKNNTTPGLRGFGPGALKLRGASGTIHTLGHLNPAWWAETVWQWPLRPGQMPRSPIGPSREPREGRVYQEGEQLGVIARDHLHWETTVRNAKVDPLEWATGSLAPRGGSGGGLILLLVLLALSSR